MPQNQEAFLTLSDIYYSLCKRWKLALFCGLLFAGMSAAFVLFALRPTYSSQGAMYVRLGKNTTTVDPTAASSQTITPLESRHQEVVSVRELLKSRAVAERVCKSIGVEKILSMRSDVELLINDLRSMVKFSGDIDVTGELTPEQAKAQKDLESAIKYVSSAIDIESPKESYLIQIDAKAHDPFIARDIVQRVMEEYQVVHLEAHKPSRSFGFFDDQVADLRHRVQQLENKKRDELNRRNILSVESERQLIHDRVSSVTNRLSDITSSLEGQRARVAELKSQVEAQADTLEIEQTGGIADAATDSIKSSVFALEVEHQKAAAVYSATHPILLQKQRALEEAREIEQNQPREREQHRNAVNPNRMALELEYAKGLSELQNLGSQLSWLDSELGELKLREKQINEDEIFFNDLNREINLAVSEFNAFSTRREYSKLTEAIDREAFSDINIAQNATLNLTKNSISRMLMLVACFISAGFFGGGCGVAREILAAMSAAPSRLRAEASTPIAAPSPIPSPSSVEPAVQRPLASPVVETNVLPAYRTFSGRVRIQPNNERHVEDIILKPLAGS
jgi:uncharacterized protein involved in exopolysaccharide biosynthesis